MIQTMLADAGRPRSGLLTTVIGIVTLLLGTTGLFTEVQGQPSATRFTQLSRMATITGVAFFDSVHGQRGVAPNGIELHPVLSFSGQNTALAPH
jgi:hypothetical protein